MNKLYILMRNDLDSLNPGKAMAQAAHVAQAAHAGQLFEASQRGSDGPNMFNEECGFITTLVLQANGDELEDLVYFAKKSGLTWGEVNDPTYPIRDGKVTHFIPLRTCVWVFIENGVEFGLIEDKRVQLMLSTFPLYN